MLVDDYEPFLDVASVLLEGMGFKVTKFSSPSDALSHVESVGSTFYDLVITDYDMDAMSGDELKNHLKAFGVSCPIVLWSGHAVDLSASLLGFDLHLPKFIDVGELKSKLFGLLES